MKAERPRLMTMFSARTSKRDSAVAVGARILHLVREKVRMA